MRDPVSKRLHEMINSNPASEALLRAAIPYAIDSTIHGFLNLFEQHDEIRISSIAEETAVNLVEVSDGLSGELYGEGWIKHYSEYPHSLLGAN